MKQQYNKLWFIKKKKLMKQQYIWEKFLEPPLGKIMLLKEYPEKKFLESPLLPCIECNENNSCFTIFLFLGKMGNALKREINNSLRAAPV